MGCLKGTGLLWGVPESQGQNLALTVLCVPHSLDSGHRPSPGDLMWDLMCTAHAAAQYTLEFI